MRNLKGIMVRGPNIALQQVAKRLCEKCFLDVTEVVKNNVRDVPCKSDSKYVLYNGFKKGVEQLNNCVFYLKIVVGNILVKNLEKLDTSMNSVSVVDVFSTNLNVNDNTLFK